MSIQLVYNWRHRLVGWKETEDREREKSSVSLLFPFVSLSVPHRQCSQNVDVNGPHHRCFELIVSSSFNQPMAVERGRSHELVRSMMGAVYVHVLRTLLTGMTAMRFFTLLNCTVQLSDAENPFYFLENSALKFCSQD